MNLFFQEERSHRSLHHSTRTGGNSSSSNMEINIILAHDVIMNILSCLPVQSLIKFKSVCKAWHALVEDPYFAEIHTGRQLSSSDPSNISFFLAGAYSHGGYHAKFYIEDLTNDLITPVNHTLMHDDHHHIYGISYIHLIGTCNGLVCLSLWNYCRMKRIVVYNPVTREYVNILPHEKTETFNTCSRIHEFGYHPATRKYKIVRTAYPLHRDIPVGSNIHVYTLGGTGTWRTRELPQIQHIKMSSPSVHLHGSLYWLCDNSEGVRTISYLDLGDEELRMMPGPPASQFVAPITSSDSCKLTILLMEMEKNLCVIERKLDHEMSIWVMKRDENSSNGYSWTKDFIVPYHPLLHLTHPAYNPILLTVGSEIMGLVCMEGGSRFIYCFDTERAIRLRSLPLERIKRNLYMRCEAVSYMRSIVSLKALGEKDVKMVVPPAPSARSRGRSWLNPKLCWKKLIQAVTRERSR